ncbi:unnamed protein product [Darwinula stevensoni]|uniref:Uncharacterized protein n=1 Tax=Darwinula stevensoni TaxID=69355 RepID=A0A7R8XES2_9CRUS|nr:unnamed protein product [Darwinula stevensoni]CAG0890903.1 unnamed protein product [Darwinula stevensoni]
MEPEDSPRDDAGMKPGSPKDFTLHIAADPRPVHVSVSPSPFDVTSSSFSHLFAPVACRLARFCDRRSAYTLYRFWFIPPLRFLAGMWRSGKAEELEKET